jgi:hypothetical protein
MLSGDHAVMEHTAESIKDLTELCMSKFTRLAVSRRLRCADTLEGWQADLYLWADNVGALAGPDASLDSKLKDRPNDIALVKNVLALVLTSLEYLIKDESTTLQNKESENLRYSIANLVLIETAVRRDLKVLPVHGSDEVQEPLEETRKSLSSITGPWRALTYFGSYRFGPLAIVLAAFTVALIREFRARHASPEPLPKDVSNVSGFYGPGIYYAWLINAVAAILQLNPRPKPKKSLVWGRKAEKKQATKDLRTVHQMYVFVSTLGVVIYAACAAVDELIRDTHGEEHSASRDAADRVCQVGWILCTYYLLRHFFVNGCWIGAFKVPSLTTSTWMLLWVLITIAMCVDNVVRGSLKSTAIKVFVPFLVGIPLPILAFVILAYFEKLEWPWTYEGWTIAALNTGTITLSVIYVFTPASWRYDRNSPAAPLSGSKLSEFDQAVALATGTLVAVPVLFLLRKRQRQWIIQWLATAASPLQTAAQRFCTAPLSIRSLAPSEDTGPDRQEQLPTAREAWPVPSGNGGGRVGAR